MPDAEAVIIREIGVPVHSVNWVQFYPGVDKTGKPYIYVMMGQQADNLFVLQIDPESGEIRQFVADTPGSNYPTATFMSKSGRLYIGSAYSGHLFCFDPEIDSLVDLGAISPGSASFPCRIDEDGDGKLWIGSYGTADLTSYDPETGEFKRYGRMDDVDMYNYPLVNSDGRIACLIRMTKPHIVVLDTDTEEKRVVGPVISKDEGSLDLIKGDDGNLYISSSAGNFRIDGMDATPVDTIPPAKVISKALSDGSTFAFTDAHQLIYRNAEIHKPNGEVKKIELKYDASGSDIFYVHLGSDGYIYGSSILPLHLFRYDPKKDELSDLGKCSNAGGEAYSMANLDGSIYISSYPGATISVYDPSKPYDFGTNPDNNPRDLGRIDDISYRPRSTLTGALGRVWTASIPDYGLWGGPLSYYDPQTEEKKAYYRICGDASCYTLAHLPKQELMAVGTSISGGSGTQAKVNQAVIFLWDYKAEENVWEGTLDRPVSTYNALLTGRDGRIYGTATGGASPELFVFDPVSRKFTDQIKLPKGHPLDLGLQNGTDGMIYGFTSSCIYRLDPSSLEIKVIVEGNFGIAGPIVGNDIYFAVGHKLMSARILERMGNEEH